MKHLTGGIFNSIEIRFTVLLLSVLFFLVSCASVDPRKVDVELKEEPPEQKITSFTEALAKLGMMTEIYGAETLRVQSKDIEDNTGTARATGGEIPRDVTEMLMSTLNSIGGKVTYIPYNPAFIQNQMVTGYSTFENKTIPDVVITGGITEFDRGLETTGSNVDVGAEADLTGAPKWVPSTTVGAEYSEGGKTGLASITIDFNMINFQTMAGISKMQTVNTIKVSKAVSEKELGVTLFGPTFGLKGSIKKVQGRHAAVRLLVQLSMVQVIGKYMMVPYWNLLPGADPDPVVMEALKKSYYDMNEAARIVKIQELLYIQGYDVTVSGEMDQGTLKALQNFKPGAKTIDKDLYLAVFQAVPITDEVLERRIALNKAYAEIRDETDSVSTVKDTQPQVPEQKIPQESVEPTKGASEVAAAPPARAEEKKPSKEKKTGGSVREGLGGRMLTDDEW